MDCDDDGVSGSAGNLEQASSCVTVVATTNGEKHTRWSLLNQQRESLLMVLSALWLTEEKLMVTPPARCVGELGQASTPADRDPSTADALDALQKAASTWMSNQKG